MSFSIHIPFLTSQVSMLIDKHCRVHSKYLNKQAMIDDLVEHLTTFIEAHNDEITPEDNIDNENEQYDDIDFVVTEYGYELKVVDILYGLRSNVLEILEENCSFRRIGEFDLRIESEICDIIRRVIYRDSNE